MLYGGAIPLHCMVALLMNNTTILLGVLIAALVDNCICLGLCYISDTQLDVTGSRPTCGCVLQWRKVVVVHWVIGQRLEHLCTDAGQFLQCLVITVGKEGAKGISCCDITQCIYGTI